MLTRIASRVRALLTRRRSNAESGEELAFHVEQETAENILRGMRPAEARRRALLDLGGVMQVRENVHNARATWLDSLWQDARYALRLLRRTPTFTTLAILMIALGTGLNAAMFSVVDAVLIRSPFERPHELVRVLTRESGRETSAVTAARYEQLLAAPGPLLTIGALSGGTHVLTGLSDPENLDDVECVSGGMFAVLGARPVLGRVLTANDDRSDAAPVIVLSHAFWRHLSSNPSILGSTLTINSTPVTVVGVMAPGFAGPLSRGDVQGWMPLSRPVISRDNAGCRQGGTVNVFARLRRNVAASTVRPTMDGLVLAPLNDEIVENVRIPFVVLMTAAACVLLIACLNVGGLQMERALARRREIALRLALGASRSRIVRQVLVENLMLAFTGATFGLLAAHAAIAVVVPVLPAYVPYLDQIALNGRVFGFTATVATFAGVGAGLFPLIELRRLAPARDLRASGRLAPQRGTWTRRALVVAEIAASVVVLIAAVLAVRTFLLLRPSNPGFDPSHKLVMNVRLRGETPPASAVFFDHVLRDIGAAPSVRAVAGSTYFPMRGNTRSASFLINGRATNVWTNMATPGYFALLKIPIVAGRPFSAADTMGSAPVMIVNQTLAARLSRDGHLLGQQLAVTFDTAKTPMDVVVIGIAADTRSSGTDTRMRPEAYVPYAQNPVVALAVIADVRPGDEQSASLAMRAAVRTLRPALVVAQPASMDGLIRDRLGEKPAAAWLLALIAGLAVLLTAMGLMATMGWWVHQRTREVAVRVALGATTGSVARLVLGQGMAIAGAGIVLGCGIAALSMHYIESLLYGVKPLDPATFSGCALLMFLVSMLAVLIPVHRAMALDPIAALKDD